MILSPPLIKGLALVVFLLVQILALAIVLIIRYHFKLFAIPHDRTAKLILSTLTLGTVLIALLASLFLSFNF